MIVALLAGGALWFISKRKKGNGGWQKADDEKLGFGAAEEAEGKNVRSPVVAPLAKHGSSAPRLSLRPVTQFIPDLAAAKKRLSRGNPLDTKNKPAGMAAAGPERTLTHDQNGSLWERRAGDNPPNPFKDPANPFADQTRALPPPPPSVTVTPPVSDDGSGTEAAAGVVAGAVAAEAPMVAAAGKNGSGQARNGPVGPEAAHVGAGAPPASNVHRVQLDFKPSMDDELELCTGQLVRVLHEYDDGWVGWHDPHHRSSLLTCSFRLSAFVLIGLNKVLLPEPVFRHVLLNHGLPMGPLEWVLRVGQSVLPNFVHCHPLGGLALTPNPLRAVMDHHQGRQMAVEPCHHPAKVLHQ